MAVDYPYMYTGRRLDKEFATSSENAVYYYRARYYIPQLGRFIGRDPMGYVDGYSLYQYVGSEPVGAKDWQGLKWKVTRSGYSTTKATGQCGDKVSDLGRV